VVDAVGGPGRNVNGASGGSVVVLLVFPPQRVVLAHQVKGYAGGDSQVHLAVVAVVVVLPLLVLMEQILKSAVAAMLELLILHLHLQLGLALRDHLRRVVRRTGRHWRRWYGTAGGGDGCGGRTLAALGRPSATARYLAKVAGGAWPNA
jgi:hypothetical protein